MHVIGGGEKKKVGVKGGKKGVRGGVNGKLVSLIS